MRKHLFISAIILLLLAVKLFSQTDKNKTRSDVRLWDLIQSQSGPKYLPMPHSKYGIEGSGSLGVIIKSANLQFLRTKGYKFNSSFGEFATLKGTSQVISKLMHEESITKITPAKYYRKTNDLTGAITGARLLNSGFLNNKKYTGNKIIICFIDTGIDWSHLDFRNTTDTTKSRILYIWDQTLTKTGSEATPQDRDGVRFNGLNYGVEYNEKEIEGELGSSHPGYIRERDTDGHGSHVAGIAAGNGAASNGKYAGIAPEADILIIKAGNDSFPDSNIMDGLSYAENIAKQMNEPIIVNLSLGSLDGPKDGTEPLDKAVDYFVSGGNGRVVVSAAGNDGDSNVHISGSVSNMSSVNFSFSVPAYTPVSGKNKNYFGFELWFNNNTAVSSSLKTPHSYTVTSTGTTQTNDGTVYLDSQIDTDNNEREVYLYVSNASTLNPAQGAWSMNVANNSGVTLTYNGWLFDSSMGAALNGGDSRYSINSPGTSTDAITVGSYVTRFRWQDARDSSWEYTGSDVSDDISSFSSIGPRVDGIQKPEITAPGQGIISVKSSTSSVDPHLGITGNKYVMSQGTSMSTPVVSGSAALLLQQSSQLSANQIKQLIINNAATDNFTGQLPNVSWGYGKVNVFNAMSKLIDPSLSTIYNIFSYDQWNSSAYTNINPNEKIAVRFSPFSQGRVTGALFHSYISNNITSPLYFEIWTDNNGLPGTKIGNTVGLDPSRISLYSWNFIDLQGTNAKLNGGSDYHLVAYFTSGSATGILIDNGNPDSRSSRNSGSGWVLKNNYDFRIRPIVTISSIPQSVQSEETLPASYVLYQNYPNPFNPSTTVTYEIPKSSFVTLEVYDILGRKTAILVNEEEAIGRYNVKFNGDNFSSGIYFYTIRTKDFIQTKKMILVK